MPTKVSEARLREAVIRIATGQSNETDEAARLKVSKATMSRAVKRIGPTLKDPKTAGTAETAAKDATIVGRIPPKTGKSPLETAREAAAGSTAPEIQKAAAQAGLEDARFCIDTLQNYKTGGVYLVAQFSGVPGNDPILPKVAELSEMAKGVIAQNASWLAPVLRAQSSKEVLVAILALEGFLAYMMIRGLASKYAPPEEPAKAEAVNSSAANMPPEPEKAL